MKAIIQKFINRLGYEIKRCIPDNVDNICWNIPPKGKPIGNALLSYVLEPFLFGEDEPMPNSHTQYWESYTLGHILIKMGYELDVVSYRNAKFQPQKQYSVFLGARTNFEHIARCLDTDCIKIVHLDTSHWLSNNKAAYQRAHNLLKRRAVGLGNAKTIEVNRAIEFADYATILGNEFTAATYNFAKKEIYRIPISTCATYDFPQAKHVESCRNNFVWFGSSGLVHKGLDLVLEAFSALPDHHLYVCGPIKNERYFEEAYFRELYQMPNIHTMGWVDIHSREFVELMSKCLALVYPTCAEGGGGSVIQCMHAGVIPIVSFESSVDIKRDFGVLLQECSTEAIMACVESISSKPESELNAMIKQSWEFARKFHTRERFEQVAFDTISQILRKHPTSIN